MAEETISDRLCHIYRILGIPTTESEVRSDIYRTVLRCDNWSFVFNWKIYQSILFFLSFFLTFIYMEVL